MSALLSIPPPRRPPDDGWPLMARGTGDGGGACGVIPRYEYEVNLFQEGERGSEGEREGASEGGSEEGTEEEEEADAGDEAFCSFGFGKVSRPLVLESPGAAMCTNAARAQPSLARSLARSLSLE